jgi:hypothetical protein
MKILLINALLIIVLTSNGSAYGSFVSQLPNGSKFNCLTCHTSQNGGSRNSFGKIVGSKYLSSGKVNWGSELAALDSDNDGFSNGKELGDPNGTWKTGEPAPGVLADISNPGDASSKPPATAVEAMEYINSILTYPNPVVNNVSINITLADAMPVRFDIYNALGELVFSSPDYMMNEGENTVSWDTIDNNGTPVVAGQYILAIKAGQKFTSGIIVISR